MMTTTTTRNDNNLRRQRPAMTTTHDDNNSDLRRQSEIMIIPPYPRKTAWLCQLTLALRLRGLLVVFIGEYPRKGCIPPGFQEPLPQPVKTLTLGHGYGFSRVRVRVALGYPRVTRDNHYKGASINIGILILTDITCTHQLQIQHIELKAEEGGNSGDRRLGIK